MHFIFLYLHFVSVPMLMWMSLALESQFAKYWVYYHTLLQYFRAAILKTGPSYSTSWHWPQYGNLVILWLHMFNFKTIACTCCRYKPSRGLIKRGIVSMIPLFYPQICEQDEYGIRHKSNLSPMIMKWRSMHDLHIVVELLFDIPSELGCFYSRKLPWKTIACAIIAI